MIISQHIFVLNHLLTVRIANSHNFCNPTIVFISEDMEASDNMNDPRPLYTPPETPTKDCSSSPNRDTPGKVL